MSDVGFALRQLLKRKGSTLLAVLILALGIGGTTAVFSVADKVLLNPIPGRDVDRLVRVREVNVRSGFQWLASAPLIREISGQTNLIELLTYFDQASAERTMQLGGRTVKLRATRVKPGFFELFGLRPAIGRAFLPDEGREGRRDVIVISHGLWQKHFGGASDAIGRIIQFDGAPCTVVGVMPPNKHPSFGPGNRDFWMPFTISNEELARPWEPEDAATWRVIGRLREGVSMTKLQSMLDTVAARWLRDIDQPNQRWSFQAGPARQDFINSKVEKTLWSLQAMIGMLLLIACANVGNLLLSRALSRRGEFGLRMAVGAGRLRLARQMLVESLLLAALAAVCGVFLAWGGILALERFYLGGLTDGNPIGMDWRVLGIAGGVATLAGLFFGMAPTWMAARVDVNRSLKESAQQHSGGFMQRLFHDGFVVVQVCLSVVLLAGAGMMIHSVVKLLAIDIGMNPKGLYTVSYDPNPVLKAPFEAAMARGLSMEEARRGAYRWRIEQKMIWQETILQRLNAMPGIKAAAADDQPNAKSGYHVKGRSDIVMLGNASISVRNGDYFRAVGATLTAGRWLNIDDCVPGEQTVVINEQMARICWPGESPLGRRFRPLDDGHSSPTKLADRVVVGVVKNIEYYRWGSEPTPGYYEPFERLTYERMRGGYFNIGSYVIRSNMNAEALRRSLVRLGLEMSPPVDEIWRFTSVEAQLYASTAPQRVMMWLMITLGGLGLLLSALGVYAVLAYSVARRTREVGIRMAVGSGRNQIRNLFMRRGTRLILNGMMLGVVVAVTLAQYLEHLLFGVTAFDPWSFAGVLLVLGSAGGLACWLPARRAASVDPMEALRNE